MTSALKEAKQRISQHQQNIKKVQCTLTTHLIDAAKLGYGKTRNVNRMAEMLGTLCKEKNLMDGGFIERPSQFSLRQADSTAHDTLIY